MEEPARRVVEQAARNSYGRLVAFLTSRSRDLASAEDALADAFRDALESWQRNGIPENPEAWLLTVARRRLIDDARHVSVQQDAARRILEVADEAQELARAESGVPDERLKLLFVCAHPEIDPAAQAPLMLQVVLGLDASRIASAFLVKPATMGQRLSRAKSRIRDAKIGFEIPAAIDLPSRIGAVLEALYAAYGSGWDAVVGSDARRTALATEAIDLGRLLCRLMPDEPEVSGLLALMLYCEARREARRDADGGYVRLSQQDSSKWSAPMLDEAELALSHASSASSFGRFQLEAAIQSAHAHGVLAGAMDWDAVALLYEGLIRLAPTMGSLVGRAAAIAEARGAEAGWTLLQAIPPTNARSYQPYWALAAHLLGMLERPVEAAAACELAIGLSEDPSTRAFLQRQLPTTILS
jgi:predicted RNA polymerase sigma factor